MSAVPLLLLLASGCGDGDFWGYFVHEQWFHLYGAQPSHELHLEASVDEDLPAKMRTGANIESSLRICAADDGTAAQEEAVCRFTVEQVMEDGDEVELESADLHLVWDTCGMSRVPFSIVESCEPDAVCHADFRTTLSALGGGVRIVEVAYYLHPEGVHAWVDVTATAEE